MIFCVCRVMQTISLNGFWWNLLLSDFWHSHFHHCVGVMWSKWVGWTLEAASKLLHKWCAFTTNWHFDVCGHAFNFVWLNQMKSVVFSFLVFVFSPLFQCDVIQKSELKTWSSFSTAPQVMCIHGNERFGVCSHAKISVNNFWWNLLLSEFQCQLFHHCFSGLWSKWVGWTLEAASKKLDKQVTHIHGKRTFWCVQSCKQFHSIVSCKNFLLSDFWHFHQPVKCAVIPIGGMNTWISFWTNSEVKHIHDKSLVCSVCPHVKWHDWIVSDKTGSCHCPIFIVCVVTAAVSVCCDQTQTSWTLKVASELLHKQTNKHSQQQHIRVHSVMQSTKTNVQNICENERNEPHIQILNPFMSWEHSWQKFVVQCVHSCQMTWFGQLFLKQTVFVIVWFSLVVLWLVTSTNVSVWCGDETEINWPLKLACFFAAAKTNIHLQQRHVGVSSAIVSSVMHQNKMLQFVVSKNIFGTAESAACILKSFDHWN